MQDVNRLVDGNTLAEVDRMIREGQELGKKGLLMIAYGLQLAQGSETYLEAGYPDVTSFATERYGISTKSRVSQLLGLVRVREFLQEHPDQDIQWVPDNERQARPLVRLLGTKMEDKIPQIVLQAQTREGEISGAMLEDIVQGYLIPGKARQAEYKANRDRADYKTFCKNLDKLVMYLGTHDVQAAIAAEGPPVNVLLLSQQLDKLIKQAGIDDLPF